MITISLDHPTYILNQCSYLMTFAHLCWNGRRVSCLQDIETDRLKLKMKKIGYKIEENDSGVESLDGDSNYASNNSSKGRLTLFLLGRIFRWMIRAKVMAQFSKGFMMKKTKDISREQLRPQPQIKPQLLLVKPPSRRSEEEGIELRAYPDPANNIDDDDVDIKSFDDPGLINKWLTRAHGNNKTSAAKFK